MLSNGKLEASKHISAAKTMYTHTCNGYRKSAPVPGTAQASVSHAFPDWVPTYRLSTSLRCLRPRRFVLRALNGGIVTPAFHPQSAKRGHRDPSFPAPPSPSFPGRRESQAHGWACLAL
jgi:hypothetical protein